MRVGSRSFPHSHKEFPRSRKEGPSPASLAGRRVFAVSGAGEPLPLNDGAIIYPGMKVGSWMWRAYAESGLYPADVPGQDFIEEQKRDLYEPETKVKFGGVNMSYMGLVTRLKTNVLSSPYRHMLAFVQHAVVFVDCPECHGTCLAQHARESYFNGVSIADVCDMELADAAAWLRTINSPLAVAPLRGLEAALDLGLGYLTLGQPLSTLSGGERQRLKLAVRLCDRKATADIIVLDEPTVGLHHKDIDTLLRLFDTLVDAHLTPHLRRTPPRRPGARRSHH